MSDARKFGIWVFAYLAVGGFFLRCAEVQAFQDCNRDLPFSAADTVVWEALWLPMLTGYGVQNLLDHRKAQECPTP